MQLDFVYTPSADVAGDLEYFSAVLDAEVVFAIEAMGTRVAMVRFGDTPPAILFADHVKGQRPVLVYRVDALEETTEALTARGWEAGARIEIPHGPCWSFTTPGGHRLAVYELARPGMTEHFAGRRDF